MSGKKIESIISKTIKEVVLNMQPSGSVIVAIANEPIYTQCFGYSDMAKKTPMSLNTPILVGSVTKQFTAVAILKALFEKNILDGIAAHDVIQLGHAIQTDLANTVSHYLPKEHYIWDGSMPAWADKVTVHQLLVHSSGLTNYTSLPQFEKQPPLKAQELMTFFKTRALDFTPGTKFNYSNSGYFLLGLITQEIANEELDTYMQTTFLDPLKMQSSFLATKGTVTELIQSDPRCAHLSRGYKFENAVRNAPIEEVHNYLPMQLPGAAGSLISSAADLLKWNNALYSEKIIPRFLLGMMLQPHILTEQAHDYYGYGIEIMKSDTLGNYYMHRGGIPGFRSRLTFIPSLDLSLIVLENIMEYRDSLMPEIENITSSLPTSLSESEKLQEVEKIIESNYPSIIENRNRYELMLVDDAIINALKNKCKES